MAKTVDIQISVTVAESDNGRKAYDNREVKPGEVLVPMMAFEDRVRTMDVDRDNIKSWSTGGRKYRVMFYPVPEACKKMAMQQFNSELNEFLGERRDGRCLIPQDDGSVKVCPKKCGDNRSACVDCPHHGEYRREDKRVDSLDRLIDECGYEPASKEDEIGLLLLQMTQDGLINYLKTVDPRYAEIVRLGLEIGSDGINLAKGNKKELVDNVMRDFDLQKSRAYQEVNTANELVKKFMSELA